MTLVWPYVSNTEQMLCQFENACIGAFIQS